MLDLVKLALRITSNAYDVQLALLISAAFLDLGIPDIDPEHLTVDTADDLIKQAVCTYCAMNFGNPENYDHLRASYEIQKAQLITSSDYTNWGDSNG